MEEGISLKYNGGFCSQEFGSVEPKSVSQYIPLIRKLVGRQSICRSQQ